jgi:uncharacterized membrane protein
LQQEEDSLPEANVELSIVVHRSVEDVFTYVSNLENLVDWATVVIAIKYITPRPLQSGTVVRCTNRLLGRWTEAIFQVIEWQPNSLLTLKSILAATPNAYSYRFTPLEDGSTRFTMEVAVQQNLRGNFQEFAESV